MSVGGTLRHGEGADGRRGVVAAVLADAMLEKFGGDHIEETRRNWRAYMAGLGPQGE
ncbi:MAG: hypothetical protein V1724_04270 [Chloroflexota bacterium]